MYTDYLNRYTAQREKIISGLRKEVTGVDAFIHGSVVRAQGPYNDIDLSVVSTHEIAGLPSQVSQLPIQISYIHDHEALDNDVVDSRDITGSLDNIVISDSTAVLENTLSKRRSSLQQDTDYIINLLCLEEQCETQAPDIIQNCSFFAAKRKSGSKRSIMRPCIIADALYTGLELSDNRSRFEKLYDTGIIDSQTLTAMFSIQRMLPEWRQQKQAPYGWSDALNTTAEWTQDVVDQGVEHTSNGSQNQYSASQLANVEQYQLVANPESSSDELINVWYGFLSNPNRLQGISRSLVQHVNFPVEEILGSPGLENFPDIKFLFKANQ